MCSSGERELGPAVALGDGASRAAARRSARRVPHTRGAERVVSGWSAASQTPSPVARSPARAPASHPLLSRT